MMYLMFKALCVAALSIIAIILILKSWKMNWFQMNVVQGRRIFKVLKKIVTGKNWYYDWWFHQLKFLGKFEFNKLKANLNANNKLRKLF